MYQVLERFSDIIARGLALAGGVVLIAIVLLTCVSIAGRALVPFDLGLGPIRGIYDMTEIGMAAAIFAFLPWAMFMDTHAKVDLFKGLIPGFMNRFLDLIFGIAMAAVAVVISWRLYLGMEDKLSYGETTLIAQIPLWYGYAAGLVGAVGFVVVSLFCVLRSFRRLTGIEEFTPDHV